MNSAMLAFSWIGIMLLIGMLCRAFIKPLGNMLMPASVIGGLIGFVFMNIPGVPAAINVDPNFFNTIVNLFFTIAFIAMGLTATPKEEGDDGSAATKQMAKGSLGMGMFWGVLYGIQPLVGFGALLLVGGMFAMPEEYGLLFPFAFCQGPGQSATFGAQIDAGSAFTSASQIAITYSVIGFLFAFLIGVPFAKWGLKKGLASHPEKLETCVMRGIYKPHEQKESAGTITTYNGNIDVLAFHMALVGISYVVTIYVQKLLLLIPNSLTASLASMTFLVGFLVASVIKVILGKIGAKQYTSDVLMARISGTATDFMIVGAFMAVQMTVVGKWLVPIMIASVIVGAVTLAITMWFAPTLGGTCDFERFLGLWGCLTGTCPSGVALIRVVDPNLKTTASAEMGMMNAFMFPCYAICPFIINFFVAGYSLTSVVAVCVASIILGMICIKVFRAGMNKPTFSWKGTKTVCPDVTGDCDAFENSGTRSQF